jgi:hypothetical protein
VPSVFSVHWSSLSLSIKQRDLKRMCIRLHRDELDRVFPARKRRYVSPADDLRARVGTAKEPLRLADKRGWGRGWADVQRPRGSGKTYGTSWSRL